MSVDLSVFDPLAKVPAPCFRKCPLMAHSRHAIRAENVRFGGKADIADTRSNVR